MDDFNARAHKHTRTTTAPPTYVVTSDCCTTIVTNEGNRFDYVLYALQWFGSTILASRSDDDERRERE